MLKSIEFWFFIERIFDEINEGENGSYIEEIVEKNMDNYLQKVLNR